MKIEQHAWCARHVRARAISVLCDLGLLISLVVGAQSVARADGTPLPGPGRLFGVHPVEQGSTTLPGGHFNFALVSGQRVSDAIVVENFSGRALRFHIYGADLITAAGGGLAPAQATATMREAGAWIVIARPFVTIAAHSQFTDAFTLRLPALVSPGQHLGAVVAAAEVGSTPQGNPIQARTALITVVTVPGRVHASGRLTPLLEVDAPSRSTGFRLTLSNTGNVLLTYRALLNIDDGNGHHIATLLLTPAGAYVVPTGQAPLAAVWEGRTASSERFRAQATVTILANGKPVGILTSQYLLLRYSNGIPILIIVGLGLVLIAIVLLAWRSVGRVSRRRRSATPRAVIRPVTAGRR
jgi:CBS domain-containing protein